MPDSAPKPALPAASLQAKVSYRFRTCDRLVSQKDFQYVFDQPVRAGSRYITLLARPNTLGRPRLGVIIGKRAAKLAVQRNRFKRTVRESFRLRNEKLANWDYLVIGKPGIADQSTAQMRHWLEKGWQKLQRNKA